MAQNSEAALIVHIFKTNLHDLLLIKIIKIVRLILYLHIYFLRSVNIHISQLELIKDVIKVASLFGPSCTSLTSTITNVISQI